MAKQPTKAAATAAVQTASATSSSVAASSAALIIAKGANASQVEQAKSDPANAGIIQQFVPGVWSKAAPPSFKVATRESDATSPQRPALANAATAAASVNAVKAPIDPDGFYKISMAKVATAFNQTFRPMHAYVVKGKVVTELGDAVADYELSSIQH